MSDKIKHFYEFEEFRLNPENQSLWRSDRLVAIPPKALETLILLVERRGEIVSRDELLQEVWKETFVEEGNINYTISLLRKTLENKNLIQTVPRRGYRFTASVREISQNGKSLTESPEPQSNSITEKSPARWIMISIFLVSLLFLTSFAYWQRAGDKPGKLPGTSSAQNAEAMQAYTRGKMILEKKMVENRVEKAIDEFQKAATLDPTFALAYAGLAEGYSAAAVKTPHPKSADYFAKAKTAAEKSLALDGNLAEGLLIRGWLKRIADWDWAGAETDLRRSIELNPKSAAAHQRLAVLLVTTGRQAEALSEIDVAYKLDPIADYIVGARFSILEASREYDRALQESEQFFRENKANNSTARAYGTILYHTENFPKVIELGEEATAKETAPNAFAWFSLLAASYHKTGQFEKADETLRRLEEMSQTETKALYSLAMNFAELGRADEAFMTLQKCFEKREERMVWLAVEPRFANLRNDLRFQELLQKMNFK
jgi:DNA-binding winged helix-turn-helix (wHTH) protein/Flp pilus assembly protein TadD